PAAGRRRLRRGGRHHHGHPRPAARERERVGPRPRRRRRLRRWRITTAVVLGALIGAPLAAAFAPLLAGPVPWPHAPRLLALCRTPALLVAGPLALCPPPGGGAAVLLYRTDLPGRRFLRGLTILTLFVPPPLFATAWQVVLGPEGWLPAPGWSAGG